MKTTYLYFRKGRIIFHLFPHKYLLSAYYVTGAMQVWVVRSTGPLEIIPGSSFPPVLLGTAVLCAWALGARRLAKSWPLGTPPSQKKTT